MIRFSVAQLEHEDLDWEGSEPAAILELENDPMLNPAADVTYHLHAQLVKGGALVTGRVETKVAGVCGRCLAPVEKTVANEELTLLFEDPGDGELDITEEVRAELLLMLPANLLCKEDCLGLCPVCGGDRNLGECHCSRELLQHAAEPLPTAEQSPWAALDALKKEKTTATTGKHSRKEKK